MASRQYRKSLRTPDETTELTRVRQDIVELGDLTVARVVQQPGWRWRTDLQPRVGGEWCQSRHIGVVLSGRARIELEDGTTFDVGPDDVFDIPPGHDAWVLGDEEIVAFEWSGNVRAWAGFTGTSHSRALATMLFTDVVDSTALAARLGDAKWHYLLASHYETARRQIERFRGREVSTTGDGMVATFDGPAAALDAAAGIRAAAVRDDVHVRFGVHVGEVQVVGNDVRGVAVHEAARVMAAAGPDEIVVSEITRSLALAAGLEFEDRGVHELKGLPGEWRLYAYVGDVR